MVDSNFFSTVYLFEKKDSFYIYIGKKTVDSNFLRCCLPFSSKLTKNIILRLRIAKKYGRQQF